MKIIRPGKPLYGINQKNYSFYFICKNCDCEFEEEYDKTLVCSSSSECRGAWCPNCTGIVVSEQRVE